MHLHTVPVVEFKALRQQSLLGKGKGRRYKGATNAFDRPEGRHCLKAESGIHGTSRPIFITRVAASHEELWLFADRMCDGVEGQNSP
jgi:hypothetical protein